MEENTSTLDIRAIKKIESAFIDLDNGNDKVIVGQKHMIERLLIDFTRTYFAGRCSGLVKNA
jgi:energy-coupling factor transporter ATP-binding protein EcfA2